MALHQILKSDKKTIGNQWSMDSPWICYKSLLASPTDQGDSQRLRCPLQGASVVTNPQTYVFFWHSRAFIACMDCRSWMVAWPNHWSPNKHERTWLHFDTFFLMLIGCFLLEILSLKLFEFWAWICEETGQPGLGELASLPAVSLRQVVLFRRWPQPGREDYHSCQNMDTDATWRFQPWSLWHFSSVGGPSFWVCSCIADCGSLAQWQQYASIAAVVALVLRFSFRFGSLQGGGIRSAAMLHLSLTR